MKLEARKDSLMGRITIHDMDQDGLEVAWIERWFHGCRAEVPEIGWSMTSADYDQVVQAMYKKIERRWGKESSNGS